ncbi:MAG: hypothetical protein QXI12_12030 [Candidatus Methanomethyliaceae archaeon]
MGEYVNKEKVFMRPGYSVNDNGSAVVYSRRVGNFQVEHVFPKGIDPAAEEIIYNKFKKQVADLLVKDIVIQRTDHE